MTSLIPIFIAIWISNYFSSEHAPDMYAFTFSESPFNTTIATTALSTGFHALYYFEVEILEMIEPELVDLSMFDAME